MWSGENIPVIQSCLHLLNGGEGGIIALTSTEEKNEIMYLRCLLELHMAKSIIFKKVIWITVNTYLCALE